MGYIKVAEKIATLKQTNSMQELNKLSEAKYYEKLSNNKVHCFLCPQNCKLQKNQQGICKVRKNLQGKLYTSITTNTLL